MSASRNGTWGNTPPHKTVRRVRTRTLSAAVGIAAAILIITGAGMAARTPNTAVAPPAAAVGTPQASDTTNQLAGRLVPAAQVADTAAALISQAQTIHLEMYELGNAKIIAALEAAHRRGVPEQIILDATETQSQMSAQQLRSAGIPVEQASIPGGIDHVKLLIAGDVLTGGVNFGVNSSYTTDLDVELGTTAAVEAASRLFATDWAAAGGHGPYASGTYGPFVTGPAIETSLVDLISSAGQHGGCVAVENYLSDHTLQRALVGQASQGAHIAVVLNPDTAQTTGAVDALTGSGAQVELAAPTPYLHAKVVACGDAAELGSANASYHGMAINHEVDVSLTGSLAAQISAWAQDVFHRG